MAKSLAKLKEQIAKLQKEADAIQSTVIARIKREIAAHGLTAEHLFGSTDSPSGVEVSKAAGKAAPRRASDVAKRAKYADDVGNSWHGIGKRPQWIHDALGSGRALEEFLIRSRRAAPASKASIAKVKAAANLRKDAAAPKKTAAARRTAKPAAIAEAAVKAPAKKSHKATKATSVVKPNKAAGPSKTPAAKVSKVVPAKSSSTKSLPVKAEPKTAPAEG